MTAILNLIYCFLMDMIFSFADVWKAGWDSVLGVADTLVQSVNFAVLTVPVIPTDYAWMLGACGFSQAVAIIGAAYLLRFTLQTIPFVRWGS